MSRKPGSKEANLQPAHGGPVLVSLDPAAVSKIRTILRTLTKDRTRSCSVPWAQKALMNILGRDEAVWLLAQINARDLQMEKLQGNIGIRIEARVSYVTSIPPPTHCLVGYKLTPETIKSLVACWGAVLPQGGECQLMAKLEEFCYEAGFSALERLQNDGGGELGCSESEKVKDDLMRILPQFESRVSLSTGSVAVTTDLSRLPPAFSTNPDFYQPHSGVIEPLSISEISNTGSVAWWPSSIIAVREGTGPLVPISECPHSLSMYPDVAIANSSSSFGGTGPTQSCQFSNVFAEEGYWKWPSGIPSSCYYES